MFTVEKDSLHDFGLTLQVIDQMFIDDQLLMDNAHGQKPVNSLFGGGTIGEFGSIELKKGQGYCIRVKPALSQGGQIRRRRPPYWLRETLGHRTSNSRYGKLVSEVDQVAVFAGLSGEWKGESFDRPNMDLSENNNELISRVLNANPTVRRQRNR